MIHTLWWLMLTSRITELRCLKLLHTTRVENFHSTWTVITWKFQCTRPNRKSEIKTSSSPMNALNYSGNEDTKPTAYEVQHKAQLKPALFINAMRDGISFIPLHNKCISIEVEFVCNSHGTLEVCICLNPLWWHLYYPYSIWTLLNIKYIFIYRSCGDCKYLRIFLRWVFNEK